MHSACFLVPSDPSAKPNLRALREADALQEAGWSYELDSVRMGPAPVGGFVSRAAYFKEYTRALSRMPLTVKPEPDIIVSHDVYTLPAGRIAAKKLGVPLIYDTHEDWPMLISEHSRLEARMAGWLEHGQQIDHVFAPCESVTVRFRAKGIPSTVLYNARAERDIVRISREEARDNLRLNEDDFIIGYIGDLSQLLKGEMFKTLFDVVRSIPRARLLVVGGPNSDADNLRKYVEVNGLSTKIWVTGYYPFDKLSKFYGALDVGLIALAPLPNYIISLPNKLFDYMAFGVPVVAPDYPEMARVIRLHASGLLLLGWLYPQTRFGFLKGVLTVAQERRTSMEKMGERGRRAFLGTYTWEHQAPKFVQVVEDLCGFSI